MGDPIEKDKQITSKEYFNMEKSAEIKSEYFNGEIFAMAGSTVNHNRITRNTSWKTIVKNRRLI